MKVSVITSVYNCDKYVKDMIDSIIGQSFNDWELIIIDDASTDKTWDIITSYEDERIIKIKNAYNMGLTVNLNKAWDLAKGEYIARIDGDDIAYSGRLSKQVNYMETHPKTVILGGGMKVFGNVCYLNSHVASPKENLVRLVFNSVISHPTMMIRKRILDKKGIRYNENLRYAQDYELSFRASKVGDIVSLPECVIKYRVHDGQISKAKEIEQKKCADFIRNEVLNDLGVDLTEKEFVVWSKLCLFELGDSERDICVAERIADIVLGSNKEKCVYDNMILEREIAQRLEVARQQSVSGTEYHFDKYQYMFQVQSIWISNLQKGWVISEWLNKKNIKTVSIYGVGYIGKNIINEILNGHDIEILCIVDKHIKGEYRDIAITNDVRNISKSDIIIVTLIHEFEAIKKHLESLHMGKVVMIEDIIHEVALT